MSKFYKPSYYNQETKEQLWTTNIQDFHDSFCSCTTAYAHLLDIIFPEGHKDRNHSIFYIIKRDQQCLSGGDAEENIGGAADLPGPSTEGIKEEEKDPFADANLEELIAAATDAEKRNKPKKRKESGHLFTPPRRKEQKNQDMSPATLQRKYLPRRGDTRKPTQPHQAAARAAKTAQAQPPNFDNRHERETASTTTSDRHFRVKPFVTQFEIETERELSKIFKRPPRTYQNDPPFYPWLPPEPRVNFNLNFKF
nr:hypothetical protein [Torque teno midi virus]